MDKDKCDGCDERKDFLVQFMERGDEGSNPWMHKSVRCCKKKLEKVCKDGGFGSGPGDSIIDMVTHELYDDPKAASKREGAVYTIDPESYSEWSLLEDDRQAVF